MRWLVALTLPVLAAAVESASAPPELARIKRIYVEQLGGGQTSDQMRDMIIAALQNAKLFAVTENQDNADAILRGSSDDKIYTEAHDTSDSLGLHANIGKGSSSKNYSSGTSATASGGTGITSNETSHVQERRHEASASLRLVDSEGDVIWSSTQESTGGKFRGATADVADKMMRQLAEDVRKARTSAPAENAAGMRQ